MTYIELHADKLEHNYRFLDRMFGQQGKSWSVVTKMLCGNKSYVEEIIRLGAREICDSRLTNLKVIKAIDPTVQTVYIKPPAKRNIPAVVKYADVSFNSEYQTIKLLSDEAQRQERKHKVIIMIELGDLREGIMGENLMAFYDAVFHLPNIEVTGIGTNLNCLHGVLPSQDKLIQLCLYQQLIEARFNRNIPWVTGGTSIVVPLLAYGQVPEGVNHFRIGETLYFGNNLLTGEPLEGMEVDVFKLYSEIIEITEKPKVPIGYLAKNPSGEMLKVQEEDYGKTSYRAILDVGLLDSATDFLIPDDSNLTIVGASSDMLIVDLGETNRNYKVGDMVPFSLKYMGALHLLNSRYVEKRIVRGNDNA